MTKSFILLASILLCGTSVFGQVEQAATPIDISKHYYGCTKPVSKSAPTFYTEQVVQRVPRSEEALDITDPVLSGLVASPNPTKGHLNVSVPPSFIGYEIFIIDMRGRFVGSPIPITGTTANVNIEGESGVYILSIKTEEKVFTERIMLNTH